MPWYIYILFCDQKAFYVGLTHDVKQRLKSHKDGLNIATKEFSDIKLLYTEECHTRIEAETREKQLKGWSIAKKKALIQGDLGLLKKLSKSRSLSKNRKG